MEEIAWNKLHLQSPEKM